MADLQSDISPMHASGMRSSNSRASNTSASKAIKNLFERPIDVIFVPNGTNLADKTARSIKLNISPYFTKYESKQYHITPDAQAALFERAYLELLEDCSKFLNKRPKEGEETTFYSTFWTTNGAKIKSIEDIKKFIYSRVAQENGTIF